MAMLIAWQALNKAANQQDARFSDAFLLVSPGITIRDRLRVLLPESPDNYYRERDLIPPGEQDRLGQARIVVTNFHAFLLRDRSGAPKVTKQVLAGRDGSPNPLQETPDQMARRVCRAARQQARDHRHQRRGPSLLPPSHRRRGRGLPPDARTGREQARGQGARGGGAGLDHRLEAIAPSTASRPSTTSRRRRSSSPARATPRAASSRGSSRTSRSSTRSRPGS